MFQPEPLSPGKQDFYEYRKLVIAPEVLLCCVSEQQVLAFAYSPSGSVSSPSLGEGAPAPPTPALTTNPQYTQTLRVWASKGVGSSPGTPGREERKRPGWEPGSACSLLHLYPP